MMDVGDLYQELLLDHNKSPRNRGKLDAANHSAEGFNPLCGDRVTIFLHVAGGVVENASFEGSGCAISTASASLMIESLKGKTIAQVDAIFGRMHNLLTADPDAEPDTDGLGKLAAFSGVCKYPARVKCATLAWHTMKAALQKGDQETVTTE